MSLQFQAETSHHCHVPAERAELFRTEDGGSTEEEYLYLLHALVLCLKPTSVLETGTYKGIGSSFIAKALKRNGVGRLTTVEIEPKCAAWGREMLRVNGVSNLATVVETDSLSFLEHTAMTFDFAFLDSALPLRCKELRICLDRSLLRPGAMVALHDTSRLRTLTSGEIDPLAPRYWQDLEAIERIKFIEFPYSRGLTLAQVL